MEHETLTEEQPREPEDDATAPAFPRRIRWLLLLIAVLIIASSAVALQTLDDEPAGSDPGAPANDGGTEPPEASFSHTCESITCSFKDTTSADAALTDWHWEFGDGEEAESDQAATHTYREPGVFRVTLTVIDDSGSTDAITKLVVPGAPADSQQQVSTTPPRVYAFGPHIGASGGWDILSPTFTSAHLSPEPETVIDDLNAAQADGKPIVLLLAQSAGNYKNPDGTFNLEMWKSRIDEYAGIDFTPWIEDGTFLVHYLISEPMSRSRWGGEVITADVLDEMARYSKQHWPTLPTTIREQPTHLLEHAAGYETPLPGWTWTYLDAAWARYTARKGPIDEFVEAEVEAARAQGLGLLFGLNVLSGGDGSSDVIGYNGDPVMSVEELMDYGPKLIEEPYGCAMFMWHLNFDDIPYFGLPEVDSAMTDLATLARARKPVSCVAP